MQKCNSTILNRTSATPQRQSKSTTIATQTQGDRAQPQAGTQAAALHQQQTHCAQAEDTRSCSNVLVHRRDSVLRLHAAPALILQKIRLILRQQKKQLKLMASARCCRVV